MAGFVFCRKGAFLLQDNIVLQDGSGKIVFHQYSFCELLKHLLVSYVGITYAEASDAVENSHLSKPAESAAEAGLLGHEYAYYWAMSLYYGNMFWEKGIPVQSDDLAVYFELENRIIKRYHLNDYVV